MRHAASRAAARPAKLMSDSGGVAAESAAPPAAAASAPRTEATASATAASAADAASVARPSASPASLQVPHIAWYWSHRIDVASENRCAMELGNSNQARSSACWDANAVCSTAPAGGVSRSALGDGRRRSRLGVRQPLPSRLQLRFRALLEETQHGTMCTSVMPSEELRIRS